MLAFRGAAAPRATACRTAAALRCCATRSLSSASAHPPAQPATSNEPVVASREAVRVAVLAGQAYKWCACGRSATQPWCDGASHTSTTIRPVHWTAPKSGTVSLCGCKLTRRRPFCDGAHAHIGAA